MLTHFFVILAKVLVMLLILVGMVLLLIGIQHYLSKSLPHRDMDDSVNDKFRRQIHTERGVMSSYNLFRRFFVEEENQPSVPRFFQGEEKRKDYNRSRHSSFFPFGNDGENKFTL